MIMSSDPFRIEYDSNNLNKQNKSQECIYILLIIKFSFLFYVFLLFSL